MVNKELPAPPRFYETLVKQDAASTFGCTRKKKNRAG
jgi:hypothetical protein